MALPFDDRFVQSDGARLWSDELLLGENDRHLDLRVSVLLRDNGSRQWATVTTAVQFHNPWGRAYFAVVWPFHQLIVPSLMRRTLRVAARPSAQQRS